MLICLGVQMVSKPDSQTLDEKFIKSLDAKISNCAPHSIQDEDVDDNDES
jgi:hypothetical protein